MRIHRAGRRAGVAVLLAAVACGPGRPEPEAPRPRGGAVQPALPPIPQRDGPLSLDLVYPPEGGAVAVRDSTFVFGSTGTGRAQLWINGAPVPVEPNGAFLAFLPVPPDGVYRLDAVAGIQRAQFERTVMVPPPPPALPADLAIILDGSVFPRGAWAALPGERIEVGFRGTAGGHATLVLPDGARVPLAEEQATEDGVRARRTFGAEPGTATQETVAGVSRYTGYFAARALATLDGTVPRPTLVPLVLAPAMERRGRFEPAAAARPALLPLAGSDWIAGEAYVELEIGNDTARALVPLNLALVDPGRPPVGMVFDRQPYGISGNDVVIGRPAPDYTYAYFWPDATEVTLTGERNGAYRVQLTPDLAAWVAAEDVVRLALGTPPPGGRVGTVRLTPRPEAVDVRLALEDRMPFRVEEGDRSIRITVYGGVSDTDWLLYGGLDPLIEWAEWDQPEDAVYRVTLHLSRRPWGYHAFWDRNGDLIVRIRRPPEIDPESPLRGLRIAIDPGHPPGGAIGPTRLTEAEANLAIALRLRPMLEAAGADVLMLRSDTTAVPLVARPLAAIRANADLFVSIHNNAFPDGVNPFESNGTSVYYFHRQSVDLARSLQRELVAGLGLRDLGIGRGNLAVVRSTWMPAALTETMYLMVPRQEAALRDPGVQERIARAHLRGIEAFLRGRALER